jgi:hypothetical protein
VTATPQASARVDVHSTLMAMSGRLELLWRQSCAAADLDEPTDQAVDCCCAARDLLLAAMVGLEEYAGRQDPRLGRREWSSRSTSRSGPRLLGPPRAERGMS